MDTHRDTHVGLGLQLTGEARGAASAAMHLSFLWPGPMTSLCLDVVYSSYRRPQQVQTLQPPQTCRITDSSGWERTTAISSPRTGCSWIGLSKVRLPPPRPPGADS